MNKPLPVYDVKELSLEEVVQLLIPAEKQAANDTDVSHTIDFEELAMLLQA